mmetsp:Transcript_30317/g.61877  ORF Transcript_30317/g.61877 Transcript_30317/m.61877 type:complete len:219 (-) Transcript_30317:87-743(-)
MRRVSVRSGRCCPRGLGTGGWRWWMRFTGDMGRGRIRGGYGNRGGSIWRGIFPSCRILSRRSLWSDGGWCGMLVWLVGCICVVLVNCGLFRCLVAFVMSGWCAIVVLEYIRYLIIIFRTVPKSNIDKTVKFCIRATPQEEGRERIGRNTAANSSRSRTPSRFPSNSRIMASNVESLNSATSKPHCPAALSSKISFCTRFKSRKSIYPLFPPSNIRKYI